MKKTIQIAGTFRENKKAKLLFQKRKLLSREEAEEIFEAKEFTRFLPANNERGKVSCLNS